MRPFGFSTGALARGDFRLALTMMAEVDVHVVELSALRLSELEPLVEFCLGADLSRYRFVSVHAPGRYSVDEEKWVVAQLNVLVARGWPVVLHPDAIHDPASWSDLGSNLLIENMDKRKGIGRTAAELDSIFAVLPEAGLCFDIAHARQVDSSMTEGFRILQRFGARVRQVHLSEVSTSSKHDRLSRTAALAYRQLASLIPEFVPIVLETPVARVEMVPELLRAREALDVEVPVLSRQVV